MDFHPTEEVKKQAPQGPVQGKKSLLAHRGASLLNRNPSHDVSPMPSNKAKMDEIFEIR